MTEPLYPVAVTAEAALQAPEAFATRETEARIAAAGAVAFVVEAVGPAFASREAALAAYSAGGRGGAALSGGWGRLTPVVADGAARSPLKPVRPTYAEGRRWPQSIEAATPAQWRLWISYWRIGEQAVRPPDEAARRLRRRADGPALGAGALSALARQPLRAVRAQQPLDIGLFEARRPEEPDLIVPDE